jgi:hypothetical protein
MDYTEAQQRAIDTLNGNLQIIACAGWIRAPGASVRERVDHSLLSATEERVVVAGTLIRDGDLERIAACGICGDCDFVGICRSDGPGTAPKRTNA